ncbi:hypothetical protein LSM04_006925 [Trypanosoma melophagium]|uniref:uncharacterized protein n=1 Tax=Trypanosoma melophagium TaxID=715481 RepID=UPI00351A2B8B|nr:hypothetical protein LSM04_006925 [Trypanosoma melophagium]
MDIVDEGIVEDVGDFFPGSPLANRGPAMRVCRLPPRRPEGHRPSLEIPPDIDFGGTNTRASQENHSSPLLNGDDDGFTMSPRLRKKKEAAKLKKMGPDTVVRPGSNNFDRPLPGEGSNLSEEVGGDSKLMLNLKGVKQETKEENPLDTIIAPSSHVPEQPKEIHQTRFSSLWGEFCTTGRDPLLGRGLSIVAGRVLHKMSVVQTKESCDTPPDEEATGVCEEVDDFLPGSPLKRDLRAPLPRHARNPPKVVGKKTAKCGTLPSFLIPDFTLPGSSLDDTVESSLNPHDTTLQGARGISQERTLSQNSTDAEVKGQSDAVPRENFQQRSSRRLSCRSTVAQSRRQSVTRMCQVPNPRSIEPLEPPPPRNLSGSIGETMPTTQSEANDKTTGGVNKRITPGNAGTNTRYRRNSVNKKGSSVTSDNVDHLTDISPRLREKLERSLPDKNTKQDLDPKYVNLPKARRIRRQSLLSDDGNDHVVDVSKRCDSNDGAGGKILPVINRASVFR